MTDRITTVPAGTITAFAGTGKKGDGGDGGPAIEALLNYPRGVACDSAGNLYIVDNSNHRVRMVAAADKKIYAFAGTPGEQGDGGDGGPAIEALLNYPRGVACDSAGNLYIVDTGNHRVRMVAAADKKIVTVAGNGKLGDSGDGGPAIEAFLNYPRGVACDSAGNLYIADASNDRVRMVAAADKRIVTVAGTGQQGDSGDGGPAIEALLHYPCGVACDSAGNLYIADASNDRVRMVAAADKKIYAFAGTPGEHGDGGDGGPAIEALLNYPCEVACDSAGNLYIADASNDRVRMVAAADKKIYAFAGTPGEHGDGGDGGPAIEALLNYPWGLACDSAGNLYIADNDNDRVRMVTPG